MKWGRSRNARSGKSLADSRADLLGTAEAVRPAFLFDPVPDSVMHGFSTDRPTKSNAPSTADARHYQYETDIFNFSYMRVDSRRAGPAQTARG